MEFLLPRSDTNIKCDHIPYFEARNTNISITKFLNTHSASHLLILITFNVSHSIKCSILCHFVFSDRVNRESVSVADENVFVYVLCIHIYRNLLYILLFSEIFQKIYKILMKTYVTANSERTAHRCFENAFQRDNNSYHKCIIIIIIIWCIVCARVQSAEKTVVKSINIPIKCENKEIKIMVLWRYYQHNDARLQWWHIV